MYCNNCGLKGHVFRDCRDPIVSCGIVLLHEGQVLMIRRKDSMSYTEFLRGKYSLDPSDYLHTLLENMTQGEQALIRSQPFDALWAKLWGHGVEHHQNEYPVAKSRFEALDLPALLDAHPSPYTEPEWGFPKGRRVRCESDLECAFREFAEETNIPREAVDLVRDDFEEPQILCETFRGTNSVMYRHIYFVARVTDPSKIQLDQKFTAMQRREISGIAWKSADECRALTRPHYVERDAMLANLFT